MAAPIDKQGADRTAKAEDPRRMLDKAPVAPGTVDPGDADPHGDAQLPHERDQSIGGDSTGSLGTGAAGDRQREVMGQAGKDLRQGQVDTDMRATPGMDAERREHLVKNPQSLDRSKDPSDE
ncbi:hypothetical protein [Roseateles sp.]|uniref:hypothetical protein n=1 Tax=Roseateles sp. TaxID=1971397 RepID=UPI0031D118D5